MRTQGRVALHYTISGLDWPDGTYMDPMQQAQMTSEAVPDLWMGAVSGSRSLCRQGVITSDVDQRLLEGALDPQKNSVHPSERGDSCGGANEGRYLPV